jgi:hypothetical protein
LEAQKVKFKARKVFGKAWKVTFKEWKVDLETLPKTFMAFWPVAEGFPSLSEEELARLQPLRRP